MSAWLHGAFLVFAASYVAQRASEAPEHEEVRTTLDLRPMGLVPREEVAVETRAVRRGDAARTGEPPLYEPPAPARDLESLLRDDTPVFATTTVASADGGAHASTHAPIGILLPRASGTQLASAAGGGGETGSGSGTSAGAPEGGAQGGTRGGAPLAEFLVPPTLLHSPSIAYPPKARRRGEEGDVRCRLHVTAAGTVEKVDVVASSGHASLDEAAQEGLLAWRFGPATRNSTPCACVIEQTVTFRLVSAAMHAR